VAYYGIHNNIYYVLPISVIKDVCVYIELNLKCELSSSKDFRDKQVVLKLMVGALAPYVLYTG